jgi:hypothetical protein
MVGKKKWRFSKPCNTPQSSSSLHDEIVLNPMVLGGFLITMINIYCEDKNPQRITSTRIQVRSKDHHVPAAGQCRIGAHVASKYIYMYIYIYISLFYFHIPVGF